MSQICNDMSLENAYLAAERDAVGFTLPLEVSCVTHWTYIEPEASPNLSWLATKVTVTADSIFHHVQSVSVMTRSSPFCWPWLGRGQLFIDTASTLFETSSIPDAPYTLAKHVFKLWSNKGSVLVLPLAEVSGWPTLHINNLHW